MSVPLSIVIPTRKRLQFLKMQVKVLGKQMKQGDELIVVVDCDEIDEDLMLLLARCTPRHKVLHLHYLRESEEFCVNFARNAGTAMVSRGCAVCEIDDHDIALPNCLDNLRAALAAGADYVFGDSSMQAIIEHEARRLLETWPDVRHHYEPGGFRREEIAFIGVRAFSMELWQSLRGWSRDVWPGGDFDFASRAEAAGARED